MSGSGVTLLTFRACMQQPSVCIPALKASDPGLLACQCMGLAYHDSCQRCFASAPGFICAAKLLMYPLVVQQEHCTARDTDLGGQIMEEGGAVSKQSTGKMKLQPPG